MSGGSLDYAYRKVENVAETLRGSSCLAHRAFALHLARVAKALHDIEWVLSCDYSPGDEMAAINKVLQPSDMLTQATEEAMAARDALEAALREIEKGGR